MQQIHQLVLFQLIRGIATTPLSSSPVGSMDMKQFTSRPATPEGASRSSSATRSGTTTRVTSVSIVVKYEKTCHVQRMHLKTTVRCSIGWFKSVVEVQKKKGRSMVTWSVVSARYVTSRLVQILVMMCSVRRWWPASGETGWSRSAAAAPTKWRSPARVTCSPGAWQTCE